MLIVRSLDRIGWHLLCLEVHCKRRINPNKNLLEEERERSEVKELETALEEDFPCTFCKEKKEKKKKKKKKKIPKSQRH